MVNAIDGAGVAVYFINVWVMPHNYSKKCDCGETRESLLSESLVGEYVTPIWQVGEYLSGKWRSKYYPKVCRKCWDRGRGVANLYDFPQIVTRFVVCVRSGYERAPSWMVFPCTKHEDCRQHPELGESCAKEVNRG